MSVIYEEQGAEIGVKEQEMTNIVHYVMRYIIKDGNDLRKEMTDLAIPVLDNVVEEEGAGYVAKDKRTAPARTHPPVPWRGGTPEGGTGPLDGNCTEG